MTAFDTLSAAEALEAAGMDPRQAKACAAQMRAAAEADRDGLATKSEFESLKAATKAEFEGFKTEIRAEFQSFRTEVKADVEGLRAEVKADIEGLRTETKADIADLKAELMKWMFGVAAGQIVLIVALLKLIP